MATREEKIRETVAAVETMGFLKEVKENISQKT
jgi:hypothetical protein